MFPLYRWRFHAPVITLQESTLPFSYQLTLGLLMLPPETCIDRGPSPGLSVNLSSNNPFRNRAASPANNIPSPLPSPGLGMNFERPTSRNPFLDASESQPPPVSGVTMPVTNGNTPPTKPALTGNTAELFVRIYPSITRLAHFLQISGDETNLLSSPATQMPKQPI